MLHSRLVFDRLTMFPPPDMDAVISLAWKFRRPTKSLTEPVHLAVQFPG